MNEPNPYEIPPEPAPLPEFDSRPNPDDCNLAMIAHLSGAAGIVLGGLIGFLGPLLIYILKKDTSQYVGDQAKEALNFQITLLLVSLGCIIAVVVSCGFLFPLLFLPMVMQVVFAIIAGLSVRDGTPYRYPFNIRFLQ
ncbi:MAG: DUF4870 domain-containing protein [Planctomycetota bacterium]